MTIKPIGNIPQEAILRVSNIVNDDNISFIENRGQIDSEVKYYIKKTKYQIYFTRDNVVFSFLQRKEKGRRSEDCEKTHVDNSERKAKNVRATFSLDFVNCNCRAIIEGQNKINVSVYRFKDNDEEKRVKQIQSFEKIVYKGLWKGIDLLFYSENNRLKYKFIVNPTSSPDIIKLSYTGIDKIVLDEDGNLVLKTPINSIIEEKPSFYQNINNEIVDIAGRFILSTDASKCIQQFNVSEKCNLNYPIIMDSQIIYVDK